MFRWWRVCPPILSISQAFRFVLDILRCSQPRHVRFLFFSFLSSLNSQFFFLSSEEISHPWGSWQLKWNETMKYSLVITKRRTRKRRNKWKVFPPNTRTNVDFRGRTSVKGPYQVLCKTQKRRGMIWFFSTLSIVPLCSSGSYKRRQHGFLYGSLSLVINKQFQKVREREKKKTWCKIRYWWSCKAVSMYSSFWHRTLLLHTYRARVQKTVSSLPSCTQQPRKGISEDGVLRECPAQAVSREEKGVYYGE